MDLLNALEIPDIQIRRSPYPRLKVGEHRLTARSGHLGHALRGQEATHIVVDEAAFVPEELVTEIAMPMLATTDGQMTLISTPKGHNHFWRFYSMGIRGEHGVWSRTAPSYENPLVSKSFLDVQRELISERAYRVEYEADFLDSAGQVFRTEIVSESVIPDVEIPQDGLFVIGIDWARYSDYTAVCVLAGDRFDASLAHIERFTGLSWSEQIERVAGIAARFPHARVLVDATGVGDPVTEMLQKRLPASSINGFVFTGPGKSQLIDNLVWGFEQRAIHMTPHPELLRELEHFEASQSASGHTKLMARGGFHDDLVIALALAYFHLPATYRPRVLTGQKRSFESNFSRRTKNNHAKTPSVFSQEIQE